MQIGVLGLGRFGRELARTLTEQGHEVLAIDRDERIVQDMADEVTKAVILDITDDEALEGVGLGQFEVGVVATADVEASVLATLNLQALGVPTIYAKAANDRHATILRRIGAQQVVIPEEEGGERFAHVVRVRGMQDYLPLTAEYGVGVFLPPAELVGQPLQRLVEEGAGTRRLLMVVRDRTVQLNPLRSQIIEAGDRLVFAGSDADLAKVL